MTLKEFFEPIPNKTYYSSDNNIHIINDEEFILINLITGELLKEKPNDNTIAKYLGITEFPYEIKDNNGDIIYYEESTGFWVKREYDSSGNEIYFENSYEYWSKYEYDSNGNEIYFENSNGFWIKREYDSPGNQIYYETSNGNIMDKRPKVIELTLEQIAEKFGTDVNNIKIKK